MGKTCSNVHKWEAGLRVSRMPTNHEIKKRTHRYPPPAGHRSSKISEARRTSELAYVWQQGASPPPARFFWGYYLHTWYHIFIFSFCLNSSFFKSSRSTLFQRTCATLCCCWRACVVPVVSSTMAWHCNYTSIPCSSAWLHAACETSNIPLASYVHTRYHILVAMHTLCSASEDISYFMSCSVLLIKSLELIWVVPRAKR